MTNLFRCPICRTDAVQPDLRGLYDDRYGYPGTFELRCCQVCGHRFLTEAFSAVELSQLYTEYYPRAKLDLATWRAPKEMGRLRLWLGRERSGVFRWVPRGVKVLDIGCGTGETLAYHAARDCEAQGVEADENIRRVADRFHLNVRVGLFRAADFPGEDFDVITLDQVIEHTVDPVLLLREAASVLRPDGLLLLSTPNGHSLTARLFGRRWVHCHTPYHLQLFSARSLARAAAEAGLRVEWMRHITHPRWYGFQWIHLISRPSPGVPSRFWTMEADWPMSLWCARKFISALGKLGVNHIVSLMLDGLRVGDNLVIALRKDHG